MPKLLKLVAPVFCFREAACQRFLCAKVWFSSWIQPRVLTSEESPIQKSSTPVQNTINCLTKSQAEKPDHSSAHNIVNSKHSQIQNGQQQEAGK